MKPNFRTCPQCSTRNRLDKEFCVKCGEPLEGIKAGDGTTAKKGKPGIVISEGADQGQSPLVPLVLVLLTLGVAFAAWRTIQDGAAATTVAAETSARKVQPSIPTAVPSIATPGASDYASGMAALRAGDFPSAVRFLRLAVAAANRADYHLGLAEALEKSGTTAEGLAEYEAAAGLDAANVRYTSEWAKALNRAGRYSEAVRVYDAALQMEPDNVANLREVSNLHMKNNDLGKARPYLERIVQLQPDDLTPRQNLARALEAAGDLTAASAQYRQILVAMPDAALTRGLLSDTLMKQNRPEEALQLLGEGLQLNANAAILYRERGRIFDRQGKNAEAVAAYREYVRLAPGANDVRAFTARIEQLSSYMNQG